MCNSQNAPKFPKPKPRIGRIAAEEQFLAHLSKAMKLVNEGGAKTREGIVEAIEAVISFLHDRGVSGQQTWPFGYLRKELDFLFEGNRSLVLQPGNSSRNDISGARFTGPGKQQIRVFAAACSQALYILGCSEFEGFPKRNRNEADQFVARHMANWPAFDRGDQTARTIKGWRDKLTSASNSRFALLVLQFTRDDDGRRDLMEVIQKGPPHIGGFRS